MHANTLVYYISTMKEFGLHKIELNEARNEPRLNRKRRKIKKFSQKGELEHYDICIEGKGH